MLARVLTDRKLTKTRVRFFAISCAAVDDVTAWCLLAVITVIARPDAHSGVLPVRFAALAAYLLVMVFAIRPGLSKLFFSDERPDDTSAAVRLDDRGLGDTCSVRAFLAGVIVPKSGRLEAGLNERLESVTVTLLLPLFFAYIA